MALIRKCFMGESDSHQRLPYPDYRMRIKLELTFKVLRNLTLTTSFSGSDVPGIGIFMILVSFVTLFSQPGMS